MNVAISRNAFRGDCGYIGMLSRWERDVVLETIRGNATGVARRVAKHRIKKKLAETLKDLNLVFTAFPDLAECLGMGSKPAGPVY